MEKSREAVVFRLIKMPCCGQLLCWVNPRRPNYCPECATPFTHWGEHVMFKDPFAILELNHDGKETKGV